MATLLRSDSSWKCLGYPPQALKSSSDFTGELNTLSGSSVTNIIQTGAGFQLGSAPGSGEYISPQLSLYGFKTSGTPAISWASGVTDNVVAKPLISETTQADFASGTLTQVAALASGDLVLEGGTNNIALGKTYTKSRTPNTQHPDTNNAEFTDGVEGTSHTDGKSFGYTYVELGVADGGVGTLEITIDLGALKWVNKATLASGSGDTTQKYEADILEILTSTDGTTFTSQGSVGVLNIPTKYLTVSFSPVKVRYVKFRIKKQLALVGKPGDWLFIMEGYIYECYAPSGSRLSPVYDISSVGIAASSTISWNATTPANTSLSIETNLSLNGGVTWQGWQVCTNGGAIPGITEGTDLSNARLQIRQTLSTVDPVVTPQLHDVSIVIRPLNPTASTTFEVDVSLDGGTTWSGWQPVLNGSALPGVDATTNLDNVRFRYRLTLASNGVVSPIVSNIMIENITGWADVLYDDSYWAAVYDNGAYGISPFGSNPSGWPDSAARWIWDRASTSSAPAGDVYFRKVFTLDQPKWVTAAFACDDKAELYVDGQYLLGRAGYTAISGSSVYLPAGQHVIAIKATNSAAGSAGLLVTMRDAFAGRVGSGAALGMRPVRVFAGFKQTAVLGLRQVRNLTANVYVVDIFNTGPSTRKVGDYFLGVRSSIDQEVGILPPSGEPTPTQYRRFPRSWVPQLWKLLKP